MECASDLADDDEVLPRDGQLAERVRKIRRSWWGEPADPVERIELQLQRNLRPPGPVLHDEVRFQMESARSCNGLNILDSYLPVAPLPPGNRRLSQSEALREFALGEAGTPASHQHIITTSHTKMVSAAWTKVWTEVWTPIPPLRPRKAPPPLRFAGSHEPDYPPPTYNGGWSAGSRGRGGSLGDGGGAERPGTGTGVGGGVRKIEKPSISGGML